MAFLQLPDNSIIVTNGDYIVKSCGPGQQYIVEIDGDLGSATVTLGRMSLQGDFVAYADSAGDPITMTAGACERVWSSIRGFLCLRVAGAAGAIAVQVASELIPSSRK